MKTLMGTALALMLSAFSTTASASLIGQDVDYLHEFASIGTVFRTAERTVEAGEGDNVTFGGININVEAESIIFTANFNGTYAPGFGAQPANRVSVLDLYWLGMPDGVITGITTSATFDTLAAGLESSDITFDDHSVSLELRGQTWGLGNSLTVFLQTQHGGPGPVGSVPEPSSIALLGLGLGLLVMRRRQQR